MAIEVFNRFEHKYLLDQETFDALCAEIENHMELDSHNKGYKTYPIANIYYDTPNDDLIRNSLAKPTYKEKLRLRSYGVPNMDTKVFFEIKKKCGGIVNKRRTVLRLNEAYEFVKKGSISEIRDYMNPQVIHEEEYFLKHYPDLEPKVYLAYDRLAFFEEGNPDLRISFDTNIRSRREDVRLESGDWGTQLLPDGTWLMEIKTSRAKPLWLCDLLTKYDIKRRSFSKYGTEFKSYCHEHDEHKESFDKVS